MSESEDRVLVDRQLIDDDGNELSVVSLNRPREMNPLDWETVLDLRDALAAEAARDSVRVIALTGAGRAFSAGGDMKKYGQLQRDTVGFPQFLADIENTFSAIGQIPKPVIALVNGIAVAGGLELMLSCDVAIISSSARVGDAHLVFGQMGGGGALTLLPRAVGPARARELVLSGRTLSPEEALDWGLVSRVVEPEKLLDAGVEFACQVALKSPLAVRNAKQVMNAGWSAGTAVSEAWRLERETTARYCLTSDDAPEGLAAFSEKRLAKYTGR